MPNTIIVQLNSTPEKQHMWLTLNDEKAVSIPAAVAPLEEISKHCQDNIVLALLPPQEVLLLTVTLPLLKKNQLLQAIPFAIQDELSDKPELYHIKILGEQAPSGLVHIAVIEKERAHYWHQLLSEHHITSHYFISPLLAAPYQTNAISIMEHEKLCIVRSGEQSGFVTDKENLKTLLDLYLADHEKPEKIIVHSYGQATSVATDYTDSAIVVDIHFLPKADYLSDLAQGALHNLKSNLLWGKLLSHTKTEKVKLYWQITLACIIAIIVIAVINKIIQYGIYSSQNASLNKQIAAIYHQNFPNSTRMVAPKQRLEDRLKSLNDLAVSNPYLDLLGSSGQILKGSSLLNITALHFNNNALSLEVDSENFADLNTVIHQLTAKGLQVTQQNAKAQDNKVSTTLVIKEST